MQILCWRQSAPIVGVGLPLVAHGGHLTARMNPREVGYDTLNGIVSAVLAYLVFLSFPSSFSILEVTSMGFDASLLQKAHA